ncbi:DUF1501 domain-containing protein [Xanthomonas maliensis]|uniref:DUF1501 domain-containing protein n=1 Tax=Xanthomonas maliensis TaxID=1321368 RepID=UPI00039DA402|nr:DUF1501 domain-containing protein [Xanthomonas maliensis]KAB7769109.1 DUF1501 domain-containing protein [Xanthomonas maliensis]
MQRRQFLLAGAAAASLPWSGRLFAAPRDSARLLVVFLRGGYDSNNLLVPYASDFYYQARPTLAIARPNADDPRGAIALDAQWGLTPVVADALLPLWKRKQVAFVPFAGTDDLSRSHFETQDDIESGQAASQHRDYRSGFMARLSGVLSGVPTIAFTDSLPLAFQGGGDLPNVSLKGIGNRGLDERQAQVLAGMYAQTPLAAAARDGLALRQQVTTQLREEMEQAGRGAASARTFADETRRMASLMRERYRLGFVDVGGWDTHANQGSIEGGLANNLRNLSEGLAAYADALGPAWQDTVVVVISEFGRTFRENGSKGTDHGHGTAYWVLGGSVHGGRIAGEQVAVAQEQLLQNRDYPVLNNYRSLFGGLLSRLWGLSPTQLERVFPGAKPRDLRLV